MANHTCLVTNLAHNVEIEGKLVMILFPSFCNVYNSFMCTDSFQVSNTIFFLRFSLVYSLNFLLELW